MGPGLVGTRISRSTIAPVALAALLGACDPTHNDPSAPPLIAESQIVGDAIPDPLTDEAGDATLGQRIFVERDEGHCVLCHRIAGLDAEFQGNVGPDLTGVGARLTPGQIRLRIADIERVATGSIMPAYYRVQGLNQVDPAFTGEPVLRAQAIEHLVAYLSERKGDQDAG